MKIRFEECPHNNQITTIVEATPETEDERTFLQLMWDKKPYVQGFERRGSGGKIQCAHINFLERKGEHKD